MRTSFVLVLLPLLLAACPRGYPSSTEYDQSCSANEDCATVTDGDPCQVCACPNAAIRASEVPRFNRDRSGAFCGPRQQVACGPCQETRAVCTNGACAIVTGP